MANSNSPLPTEEERESKYNPGELKARETFGGPSYSGAGVDQAEAFANDPKNASVKKELGATQALKKAEEMSGAGYTNNFTGGDAKKNGYKVKILKRVGIFGGAGGIIGVVIFLLSGFLPMSGLILNLSETSTANRDSQGTIFSRRLYNVVDKMMSDSVTSGSCQTVKIACRFSRPSNALLANLERHGIVGLRADGTPVGKTSLGFNEKPAKYQFTGPDGKAQPPIDAKDFGKNLRTNSAFNKAFTLGFNGRYWAYADSFIKNLFYKPNSLDRSGQTTKELDPDNPTDNIKNIAESGNTDDPLREATDPTAKSGAARELLEEAVENELEKTGTKVVKGGLDPIITGGVLACVAMNAPGFVTKVVRLYQMRQEIALAFSLVLVTSSMLKSGDVPPETMALVGGLLTASSLKSDGTKTKSAMDSFGIKNILFNDTSSPDESYKKMIPGYAVGQQFKPINEFANSPLLKEGCSKISSPEADVAAGAIEGGISVATGGAGAVVFGIVKGAGKTLVAMGSVQLLIEKLVEYKAVEKATNALFDFIGPDAIADLLGNEDIANATEEDLGNAVGGGLSLFFSQSCLATGCAPLTTSQLSSYNKISQESMIAYAEQEREGRSPFDISSPYTFLGSIVSGYYKNSYVPGSFLKTATSSIGYTLSQFTKLFSPNSYAAADDLAARCGYASEFGVDSSIAIGAFGEICAGIPAEYLDESVDNVLTSVEGDIDEDTGMPTEDGEISLMLGDCGTGDLLNAKGCTITDQKRANQSIYMYDLRIITALNGDKD